MHWCDGVHATCVMQPNMDVQLVNCVPNRSILPRIVLCLFGNPEVPYGTRGQVLGAAGTGSVYFGKGVYVKFPNTEANVAFTHINHEMPGCHQYRC